MIDDGRAFSGLSDSPCPVCLRLAWSGVIRPEMVMPLPATCPPRLRSDNKPCCRDCASADGLASDPELCMNFEMARVAVGNDRVEHLRMPLGMSESFGLIGMGRIRPCSIEDLAGHQEWLSRHRLLGDATPDTPAEPA